MKLFIVTCLSMAISVVQVHALDLLSYGPDQIEIVKNSEESEEVQALNICQEGESTDCIPPELEAALKNSFRYSSFMNLKKGPSNRDQIQRMVELASNNEKKKHKQPKGYVSIKWGYNKTYHWNRGDAYFDTPEGNFVVRDAKGYDRPSNFTNILDYFKLSKFTIPQYNVELNYLFYVKNKKIEMVGFGIGTDHMKWVFDNQQYYEIEGEFSPDLFLWREGADAPRKVTFDEVKASGDASWLGFEHTDGYNYAFLNTMVYFNVLSTKNGKIKILPKIGAGLGVLIPKTRVAMHRDQLWQWKTVDNKFHLAGGGAHVEAGLNITFFDRFFIEGHAKTTFVTVVDSLVNGQDDYRLRQPFIGSTMFTWFVGYKHPIRGKKDRQNKKGR